MVGGKRVEFGVEVDVRGVDPNPGAGCIQYIHIRMDLCDWHRQGGSSINNGMLTEKNDLAGGGGCGHVSYDK
jgi:hypothetical protein